MPFKKPIALWLLLGTLILAASAADLNYPYANIRLSLPPSEDPYPGMGNYYSTLSQGIKTALWNPASLAKLKLSEAYFSFIAEQGVYHNEKNTDVAELSGTMEITSGSGAAAQYGVFFRYPAQIGSGIATREIEISSKIDYATSSSGANFAAALKVNDWLAVGFTANNPIATDLNIAGDFPVTAKTDTNLYGKSLNEMQIDNSGKLRYTFQQGGITTTYESTQAIWNGFLSQEVILPVTNLSEMRNNLNVNSPFVGTVAGRFKQAVFGFNFIPINATCNINNDVRTVVNSDTADQFIYSPDFDPNNQGQLASWINDPDKYGTAAGYKRKQIDLPNGEVVATSKYNGFYAAATTRLDLGLQWDFNDWCTAGLALENIGGAALNFKGNGLASYISYRDPNTAEAQTLLEPGGSDSWAPFSNTWKTTNEVNETHLALEPEKNYSLPKRVRFGIATKRPFTIALDIENNQVPINVAYSDQDKNTQNVIINNLTFIRLGMESRLFNLPTIIRGGLTLMPKPSIAGLTAEAQQKIDDTYNNRYVKMMMGNIPVKLDLGSDTNFWGTIVGLALGVNGQCLLNLVQFDTTNIDLTKMAYGHFYLIRDAWQLSYIAQADPAATAAAYQSRTVPAGQTKNFESSDLKFVQTLGVTYKF